MYVNVENQRVVQVLVDIASAGDNTIVAVPSHQKIMVISGYLSPLAGSAVKIALKLGARTVFPQTSTDIGSQAYPYIQWPARIPLAWYEGAPGESLIVSLSAAVSVRGHFEYQLYTETRL